MRRVLPGGAVLGGTNRDGRERPAACRPLAAVVERTRPRTAAVAKTVAVEPVAASPPADTPKRLVTVKLAIEVLVALVGLIGAVLALFGVDRK